MDAQKAWKQIGPPNQAVAEMIIVSVDAHIRTIWRGRLKQHIPLPATYLRGKLWEDELDYVYDANPGKPRITANDGMPSRDAYDRAAGLK